MVMPKVNVSALIVAPRKFSMQRTGCNDDASLIREVQRGNHAAFEKLVYAYDQGVLSLALRITGSQVDAQDIYHEIFLTAFKNLDSFRDECWFLTWIYRIATNVCLNFLRKKQKGNETSATEVTADGKEYELLKQVWDDRMSSNAEQQVSEKELAGCISLALTKLTPHERIVFELKHYQGMTLLTVSGILKCSEATIKTTLFRATQKLRLHLAGFIGGRIGRQGAR